MKCLLVVLIVTLVPVAYHSYASYRRSEETRRALEEIAGHSCCDSSEEQVPKLRRLLSKAPDCLEARYMLAEAYESMDDLRQEERQYSLAVKSAIGNPETHYKLGDFYLMRKRYGRAAVALRKCLALDSDFQDARELLARCYERMGESDAALRTWGEILKRKPNDQIAQRAVQRIRHVRRD